MELGPCVTSSVERVNVVWIGSCVCFSAVDDDDVVSPEGGTMAATFGRGRWTIG
jgi:hypothetical protein